jgi:DNA-binding MarR family transcriptional regulator
MLNNEEAPTLSFFENCILFLLGKAYQKAQGIYKNHLQSYGLTPIQFLVLEALFEEEGISAGDIGRRLVLDNATLSGILGRLAEGGWITKSTADDDRRFLRLSLTPKAKENREALVREGNNAHESVLKEFRMEERLLLERLLRDFQK